MLKFSCWNKNIFFEKPEVKLTYFLKIIFIISDKNLFICVRILDRFNLFFRADFIGPEINNDFFFV